MNLSKCELLTPPDDPGSVHTCRLEFEFKANIKDS